MNENRRSFLQALCVLPIIGPMFNRFRRRRTFQIYHAGHDLFAGQMILETLNCDEFVNLNKNVATTFLLKSFHATQMGDGRFQVDVQFVPHPHFEEFIDCST